MSGETIIRLASTQTILIRAARPADAAAIARAHLVSHRETYGPIFDAGYDAPDLAARCRQWQDWLAGGPSAFVAAIGSAADEPAAEDAEDIVGFVHAETAHLTSLYVLRAYQQRGLGRRLLARLLTDLHRRGHGEARFHVLPANRAAAEFYERMGARWIGHEVDGADGKMHEDLLYVIATDALRAAEA